GRRLGIRDRRGVLPQCKPSALGAVFPHVRLRAGGAARDGAGAVSRHRATPGDFRPFHGRPRCAGPGAEESRGLQIGVGICADLFADALPVGTEGAATLPRQRPFRLGELRCRGAPRFTRFASFPGNPGRSGNGRQISAARAAVAGAAGASVRRGRATAPPAAAGRLRSRLLFHRDVCRRSPALSHGRIGSSRDLVMTPNTRRGLPAAAACALLAACMHTPPAAPLEPAATLARFNARTLPGLSGALPAALAQSELAESIWQVRAALRRALLDAVSARDETALLEALIAQRQALVDSDRARVQLGDLARTQMLADELELARARQRWQQSRTRAADAVARLAAAVGVPSTALASASVRWDDWAAIGALQSASSERWRTDALIGRPQITHALREYDLSQLSLQREVARRWPQLHITPAYSWGGDGIREDARGALDTESALGVSF